MVREVRFQVRIPGYRTRNVTLVTTLLDAPRYSARALARLDAKHWQVEEAQPDYTSRRRWVARRRVAYHLCERAA